MRHFDHGYAVTSHSSQGLTTGRILANMDGETARSLVNTRLAYVAISRASEDARIYTNDAATIGQRLATEITKTAAVEFHPPAERVYTPAEIERHDAPMREALEYEDAAQFQWKGETGTIQTYQHTETGRNIHIDSKGQFYSQAGKPTDKDAALERAMPAGRAHSQNEFENDLGLGR
jgi:hypothetical protein